MTYNVFGGMLSLYTTTTLELRHIQLNFNLGDRKLGHYC